MMVKVLCVVGSIRKDSINRELAIGLSKLFSADYEIFFADIKDLPLYNQDYDDNLPAAVVAFKAQAAEADAVLFVTPEYNRSMPGVLKNALDIGSRPYGTSIWDGKPAAVIGTSTGAIATALAQHHLRQVLSFLNMATMAQPEAYVRYHEGLFNAEGEIVEERTKQHLQNWVTAFEAWIQKELAEKK